MSDGKDFPVKCSECEGHVWRSHAVSLNGKTYCEDCASKEPDKTLQEAKP